MKGIITLNIEVDYGTMLHPDNQGALYMFTGARTPEEMVQIHMDALVAELTKTLQNKPLVSASYDAKLLRPQEHPVEEVSQEVEEHAIFEEADTPAVAESAENPFDKIPDPLEELVSNLATEEVDPYPWGMVDELDNGLEHVSIQLGIPQRIKANPDLVAQLQSLSVEGEVLEYKGFPVEPEGMEEPFMIVYKAYDSNNLKFYTKAKELQSEE